MTVIDSLLTLLVSTMLYQVVDARQDFFETLCLVELLDSLLYIHLELRHNCHFLSSLVYECVLSSASAGLSNLICPCQSLFPAILIVLKTALNQVNS